MQRRQSKQAESTEDEEMKQQQRMVIMKDLIRKIRSTKSTLRTDGGSLSCWRQTVRKCGFTQDGKILSRSGFKWLEEMKKRDDKGKMEELHQHKAQGGAIDEECGRQCWASA